MTKTNKLYNDDCLNIMEHFIDDESIDMIFCDLPYGVTRNSWDTVIPFDKLWLQYERIIKKNGAIVLTSQPPFDKILACSNLPLFRYEWIWEKSGATGFYNANKMPMKTHENILVFYKNLPVYNPQKTTGHKPSTTKTKYNVSERNYNGINIKYGSSKKTDRFPRDVIYFPIVGHTDILRWHPTQKPVPLIEYFIKTYTNENNIVLDNCMGSGSTIIAAINTKRKYIGIERYKEYYDKASEWINNHQIQEEVKNSSTLENFFLV